MTSGGYAHYVDASLAMGYVPRLLAGAGQRLQIEINGEFCNATVQGRPVHEAVVIVAGLTVFG